MKKITNCLLGLLLLFISLHQSFAQNTLNLAGLSGSSTSTVAYSLRRLSTGYTGNLIEVRRSSDNTTSNIGYDGSGNLDVTALTTFVGAGDGFIRTWYDQSGNANNGVQSSNSLQPQIVSSGTVLLSNLRPVIRCNGTTYIDGGTSSYGITGAHTLNAMYNFQSGTVQHIIDRAVAGNPLTSITGSNQGQYRNDAGTLQTVGSTQSTPFSNIFTATWDGSNNINHYKNGVVDYTGTLTLPATLDIMRIGKHFSITGTAVLNFWEVILFPSAISNSERLALEANQFVYYNFVPSVTAVTPLAGNAGTAVSVTGANFNATSSNNIVYFGATQATVSSATTTSLNVTVPVGSTFSPVTVQNTNYGFAAFSQYAHLQTYNNAAFVSGKVNFDPKVDITAGNAAQGLVFVDIDGDGKADMIAVNSASNNAYVYRNISSSGSLTTGSFAAPVTLTTAAGPLYAAVTDIDGDGKRDIIVSNSSANSISIFRNTSTSGSISLSAKVDFTTATAPNVVATGDIDGDGRPDVTVGSGSSSVVSVFRNTSTSGTISLAAKVDFSMGGNTRMAALRDIDGDGKQDMITACNSCAVISIFHNTATPGSISSGSFATKVDFTTGTSPREIAVSDIDGDGKPDVVVTNTASNSISVFRNLATSGSITTGSLSAKTDFTTANGPRGLDIGDIDGDGKPDVTVACGSGNSISVFHNTATSGTINSGSFAARVDFPAMASGSPDDIAVGDLDGDGRADIAVANSTFSSTVSVFRNNPLQPITGTLTVCTGNTTTLSSGTGNGMWSSSNTGIATVGSASGGVTGVAAGIVTITYAGSAGTSFALNYITTTVTVNTVSGGSNVAICQGGSTILTASGNTTYTWAPAAGLSATTGSSVTATPTITTTYSITATGAGCTNAATVTVTVNSYPVVAAITGNTTVSTAITTALASTTGGGIWTSAAMGVATIGSSTGVVSGISAGTALISYTVTTSGCSTTVTTNVTVNTPQSGLNFDGVNDNVDMGNVSVLNFEQIHSFTIEAWVKIPSAPAFQAIAGKQLSAGAFTGYLLFTDAAGNLNFQLVSNYPTNLIWTETVGVNVTDNQWHHVAVTYNGTSNVSGVTLYVDGVAYAQSVTDNSLSTSTMSSANFRLGDRSGGGLIYAGTIDEVRIWDVVRSQANIVANMNCDVINQSSLIAYYRFNEGTASGTNTALINAYDYSSYDHCGTLNNFAQTGSTSNYVTGAVGGCFSVSPIVPASTNTGTPTVCTGQTTSLLNSTSGGSWSTLSSNVTLSGTATANVTVTGVTAGTANVTYTLGCGIAVTTVSINTSPAVAAITGNTTVSTAITTTLASATGGGVWTSAATGVATIGSTTGVVTGVSGGTALISYTVTTSGCSTTVTTNVTVNTPQNGLAFDGTNDYVVLPTGLTASYTDFTFEAWVYPTSNSAWQRIMDFGNNTTVHMFLTSSHNGAGIPRFAITTSSGGGEQQLTSSTAMPLNTWSHIAVTINAATNTGTLYLNGNVVATNSGMTLDPSSLGSLANNWLGRSQYADPYFNGREDEVRIWNIVRSQSQIQANMNCDVAQQSNLIAYYRFNQGTAGGTNTGLTCGFDYSGNSHSGTLTNFALTGTTSNYVTGAVGNCNTATPIAPASFSGNTPVCVGSTITLSNANTGGIWSTASGSITLNSTSGLVTGVTAGTATVNYTLNCSSSSVVVTINALPAVAAITGTTTLTVYNTTTLANGTPSGVWTSAATGTATVNSTSGIVSGVAEGTARISYTVTNGSGCSATVTANVTVSGHNGIKLDGTNDYFITPDIHPAISGTSVTVELWFRANAAGVIVDELGSPGVGSGWHDSWIEILSTGEVRVRVWSLSSVSLGTVSFGTWHHVALRHNATTNRLDGLLDGVPSSSSVSGSRSTSGVVFLALGIQDGTNLGSGAYFNGSVDEIRIWNRVLCDGEVVNNMAGRLSGSQTGLVAYYTLDQGIGGGTNTGLTTAIDYSGNGRNATLNNIALTGTASNWVTGTVNATAAPYTSPVITASSNVTICNGSSTGLTVSGGTSYRWSPATGLSATTGSSVTANPSTTRTYTITDVCGGTATVQVSVNTTPTVSGGSSTAICIGSSTGLTASGASTYTWAPSASLSASTGTSVTATPTVTTIYTVTGTNGVSCSSTATVTVTVNPYSTVHSVTGGGPYCAGTAGSTTGLSGSDAGFNYQLYKGVSTIGSVVAGTGSAISFGPQTLTGTYTVVAIGVATPGCTSTMSGSTFVSILTSPAPVTVLGGGAVCGGGPGVSIGLGGSAVGIDYQLYLGATPVGSPVVGVGTSLSFGLFTTLGTYTVIATNPLNGCFSNMTGSAIITAASGITAYAMTGGGSYCSGGTGANIGLANSATGLNYQLFLGSTAMGSAVAGTGSAISFGLQTIAGTYTVVGTNTTTGCFGNMTGSLTISIDPLPNIYTVTGGGAYCAGGAGMPVGLSLSQSGVNYQLYNGASPSGSPVPGTGAAISLGAQTAAGNYTIIATDGITTCTNTMGGSVTVSINALPTVTIGAGTVICAGLPTGLTAGGAVDYTWSPATALTATTGSSVTANPTTTTTYTVTGTDANGCINTAAVTVTVNPLPTVSGGASVAICNGSSAGLTASGALTYIWSPATALSATTGTIVTANPTSTITYSVTGTDGNGCENTATVTVTVNPLPTISGGVNVGICQGSSTILTSSGGSTYVWSLASSLSASTGTSVTATPTITTIYTVTGTDVNSCVNTATVQVSVNPLPAAIALSGGGGTVSNINLVAGNGSSSYPGDGFAATSVGMNGVSGVVTDASGNIYYTDYFYHCIRKINTSGIVTTVAGTNGFSGFSGDGGPATNAHLNLPFGLALDAGGNLYIGDAINNRIRKVSTLGIITTVAGGGGSLGDGGPATAAIISNPYSVVFDGSGNMYIGDNGQHRIRMVTPSGIISTIAGTGTAGVAGDGGPATAAQVNQPVSLAIDAAGNLYIGDDVSTGRIRKINTAGIISTYAGTGTAGFSGDGGPATAANIDPFIYGLAADGGGNLYFANFNNNRIRKVNSSGIISTISGSATGSYTGDGGPATAATLANPVAVCTDISGNVYVGDIGNNRVRKITVTTGGSNSVCAGANITLTDATSGGTWSASNANATVVGSTGVVTGATAGTSTITYTLPTGCFATTIVTINALPTISAGSSVAICTGLSTVLTASGGLSYTWSPATTLTATTGTTVTASPTVTTTYIVTGTNANGCANTATVTVTVNTLPTVSGGSNVAICAGSSTGLTASGASTYTWSPATALSASTGVSVTASPTLTTTYTVTGTDAIGCPNTAVVTVSVNPLPNDYAITGGGSFCSSTSGTAIGLAGSDLGVNYQLYIAGLPVGSPVAGTGAAISFGLHTASGVYTVVVTNAISGCTFNITGSTTLTSYTSPAPVSMTGGGAYCFGGTGVSVGLAGSASGVNYQLYLGGSPLGSPVAGIGMGFSFGLQTVAGTYTAIATNAISGCTTNMTGTAVITVHSALSTHTVTGGGNYCSGGSGVVVGLNGSDPGVNYQLYRGGLPIVSTTLAGTGSALSFGAQTIAGVYTVVAIHATNGCTANMTASATVTIDPLPTVYTVTGGGNYCTGGSGMAVGLSSSDVGIDYQLYLGGSPVGSPVSGTGSAISFGTHSTAGIYTVVATNTSTSCVNNMTGSATIAIYILPSVYIVSGGGSYCSGPGLHIYLGSSGGGTNYQLFNGVTPVGSPVAGTGAFIDFGAFTTPGTYTVVATNASTSCTISMTGSATITGISLPSVYTITGGGSYCSGGTGMAVGLSNSDLGINYQLYRGVTAVGSAVAGSGAVISFGMQTAAGTYTVVATNASLGCTSNMTGSAVIIVNSLPAPVTMTGGGAYCTGGSGVSIGLSGSAVGIDYQLYLGATPIGSAVTGIGTALSFGTHTTAGTYTAVATNTVTTCANTMSGSAAVTINPLPTVYTVTGGGSYCSGSTGLPVGLSSSQAGVNYQLYNGASTVGSPVSGTGIAVTFGIQTAAGTYTVVATNASTGCVSNMTGSATITINALPIVYTVTGGGAYCVGSSGSVVGLSGSDVGIDYRLYNGSSAVGSPVVGTGSTISFGTYTVATTYTVTATNTVTGCLRNMSGSASITINSLPAPVLVTGGGTICIGGTGVAVGLAASASGISYQLYVDGTPVGSPLTGVGSSLSFGLQTAIGTYTATGTHPVTGCSNNMTGSVVISNYTPPTAFAVTGGGGYCTGGTGVVVGLAGSATGVIYQLYRGVTAVGSPLAGTGAALSFGLHTTAGSYTVIATTTSNGCTGTMTGSAVISIDPLPTVYSVTGGGSYCSGGAGVSVGISNSDIGTNYQLYNGVTPIGSAIAGTGAAISFGSQTTAGTYTVAATIAATSCSGNMTGSAVISINLLPTAYTVTGGGSYCSGPGVHVYLSNSTIGVNYQLYHGATPVGSAIAGTAAILDFGGFTTLGTYTVVATNTTTACVNNMSGSAVISGFALPAIYTVTGGGGYCSGGVGSVVGLSNSDVSVDYQLYLGASPVGGTVAGTGSSISFGPQAATGTYTVLAINSGSSCTSNMTGSATVSITALPTAYTVTGGGSYCLGGIGVVVGLSSSASGVNYQLYNGVTTMGSPVAGTGAAISFGLQTVVGTYTVVATDGATTCTNNMTGSATISTVALPTAYTVTGGGSYCAGGIGATISLSGSQTGVDYQLFNGVTSVGSPVAGTGSALSFGLHTSAGAYTVVATNTSTTCSAAMTGSVTIITLPLPTAYAITGGGGYCSGGSGVSLGLAGSDIGISYQLYLGTMAVGSALSGTGSAISFGTHINGGTYTVLATNTVTGCTASMGSATITVYALPGATTVSGGGAYCSGGTGATIWLPGSGVGVNYQLFLGATPVGSPVAGVGTYLSLGTHTTIGTYTVVATNVATGCTNNMTGSATVSILAPLTTYTVTGGGSYCTGGAGVVVGLSGSATGVEYKAYRDGLPLIGSVSGTGSAISFGLQTIAGTYTVIATNTTTTCTLNMTGSAAVSVDALPSAFTVTGGGSYCIGGTGMAVGLSSSTSGIKYQLYRGTTAVGSPVAGTGSAISFGLQTTAGTYTATATNATTGCFNTTSGSVSVGINSLPPAFTVTGGGSYCAGGSTGPNIYLSACSGLTTYQLYLGATPVGSPVAATGGSINFGSFTTVGTYSVTATSTLTGCTNNMTGSATISTIPLPTVYTVTGGGSYCTSGSGVAVGLSASNTGISYQLYRAATAIGAAVTGTGSAISFGVHSVAGTYTVVATVIGTFCTSNMSSSAVVAINPLPTIYSVTGGGSYCSGGTGVNIGLSSSVAGTNYQLYRGVTTVGSPVAGTGSAISFGLQTTAGTYTVVATIAATGCVSNMTGSAAVAINTLPTVYTVTGGGSYCTGGTGVLVGLSASQTGTSYQLFLGGSPVGSVAWGTGVAITFGLKTAVGTYTVVATNSTSCTSNMTGSATVSVNPLPTDYTVTGGGSYCAGGTGVAVGLSNSQTGVNYQLYRSTSAVGSPVAGTGSAISFGLQTVAGTYTVKATDATTGCFLNMTGSATVSISAAPTVCAMTGGGSYCSGGTGVAVGLSASISGVTYQLYLSGSPVGSAVSGTGAGISFGLQTVVGTYTAVATNGAGCTSNMSGTATVAVNVLPTAYTVTGGGGYCAGGTGVNIFLSGSASGVAYRVFLSGSPVTSYIYGTGSALNFGKYTAAGTYTVQAVTLTTGCVATMTGSATVTINPIPTITGSYYTVAPGSTRTLSGSPTGGVWTSITPSVATIGSSTGIVSGVALGSTYIYYTVSGCIGYRIFWVTPTGLREAAPDTTTSTAAVFKGGNIYIAPNPTRGMFMIRGSIDAANAPDAVTLDVTNMLGQVIHSGAITTKDGEINQEVQLPSSLANGMYIVTLRAGGESKVFHLVVER